MEELTKIKKLLRGTTENNKSYNGTRYDYGYHTLYIDNEELIGQRKPKERLKHVNFNFNDKIILDIGSNQGGMLYELVDQITYGIGIDYDTKLVNISNKISKCQAYTNLEFYHFDLDNTNLDEIKLLSRYEYFDVTFLLAVCMWIKNWKNLIEWVYNNSHYCLFETNGSSGQQNEQITFLKDIYNQTTMLSEQSNDDVGQRNRKLIWCSKK